MRLDLKVDIFFSQVFTGCPSRIPTTSRSVMNKKRHRRNGHSTTTVDSALLKARSAGLISYDDLPVPWRINEYVVSGYRFLDSEGGCIRSMFTLSNESFNIWSHLIGLVLVFYITSGGGSWKMTLDSVLHHHNYSSTADNLIAAILVATSLTCLFCSSLWHTMNCLSKQSVMEKFDSADLMSVTVLVTATTLMIEYTGFYCDNFWRKFYTSITGSLGLVALVSMTLPTLRRANMSWLRVACFLGIGFTSVVPVFQLLYSRGATWTVQWYRPMGHVWPHVFIGAVIYSTKIPERFWPGKLDYIGSSHNIWHVAALIAILRGHWAMQEMYRVAVRSADEICLSGL